MIVKPLSTHRVQIEMHLPGGYTRVVLYDIARGDVRLDIPTENIPLHLRAIGSKLLASLPQFAVEASDTPEAIRDMCRQAQIQELNDVSM